MDKKDTTHDELKQASSNETETKESEKIEDVKTEENENTVELETQETEVFVMGNKSEDEKLEEKTEVLIAQFPVAEKTEVVEEKIVQSQESELEKIQEEKVSQEKIQEEKNESVELAQENSVKNYETSVEKTTEKPEKQKSKFRLFFEGLYYRLSYTPALGFVGVMAIVCYLGWTFFLNTGKLHMGNTDVENACLIMIFFFAFMCILFCLLFVSSIILNIIRRIKGKR